MVVQVGGILSLIGVAAVAVAGFVSLKVAKKEVRKVCKDTINPFMNKNFFGPLNKILKGIIAALNLLINTINNKVTAVINIINLMIEFLNNYVYGLISQYNKMMLNMRETIDLVVNISSGHLIGWFGLLLSTTVNVFLEPMGIPIHFTTAVKIVRFLFYSLMIGNFYNILDYLSSDFVLPSEPTVKDCTNY